MSVSLLRNPIMTGQELREALQGLDASSFLEKNTQEYLLEQVLVIL